MKKLTALALSALLISCAAPGNQSNVSGAPVPSEDAAVSSSKSRSALKHILGQMCVGNLGQHTRMFLQPVEDAETLFVNVWGDNVTGSTESLIEPMPGYPYWGHYLVSFTLTGEMKFRTVSGKRTFSFVPSETALTGTVHYEEAVHYQEDGDFRLTAVCHTSTTIAPITN